MDSAAIDHLFGMIVSVIENEASLLGGVTRAHNAINELKNEHIRMRSFLEDAHKKKGLTQGESSWVADVREMGYCVEDVIEEFMYHVHEERKAGKLAKLNIPKKLWIRYQLAKKIEEINKELRAIPERNQRYGVNTTEGIRSQDEANDDHQRRAQNQSQLLVFAKDDHVVGIEDDKNLLLDWLTDGEAERKVISVVGMGGCGKSTLVAKVYNDPVVKRHFDCHAWITVSQTYITDDLLKDMIKQFYISENKGVPMKLSSMRFKDLGEMLIDYLRPKRYIVVLDDVWDNKLWKDLNITLPDEGLGSRLILTTRNEKIATTHFGVRSHVHKMKPLEDREAWDLFSSTAFLNNPNRVCPEEIKGVASDILHKCEGLPLAILALGGALSSKKMVSEWIDFNASLNQELSSDNDLEEVKHRILLVSFNDLPYRLKRCFLYCCMFPEDYPIRRKRLIRLWMAEGFIETVGGITPEALADNYLMELVHRNMLQVVKRNPSGRPKTCKMHDMMRELALSMSKKVKFCIVYDARETQKEATGPARRMSIQTNEAKSFNGIPQLRSLLVFISDTISPSSQTDTLPSGFRLLRALDLQDVPVEKLPDELVKLFNLRYLNLKRTKVKELPRKIARLSNLETLDIRDAKIEVLPAGLGELEKLRHLIMYRYNKNQSDKEFCYVLGTPVPSSICKITNLQVLACAEAEPSLLRQIKDMTQLTRIGLTKVRKEDEDDLCTAIGRMNLLRYLFVMVTDEEECLQMDSLTAAPRCLTTLILAGKMQKVPSWFHSLHSLVRLYLHWSRLREDLLTHIQSLPNLGELSLVNAYAGDNLYFSSGFSKLKRLYLGNQPQLRNVTINKGVMPALEALILIKCTNLQMLPQGIEHLAGVESLHLELVSPGLVQRIRGETSVDRPRVRHIPKIKHYYESQYGLAYESLSRFDSK